MQLTIIISTYKIGRQASDIKKQYTICNGETTNDKKNT